MCISITSCKNTENNNNTTENKSTKVSDYSLIYKDGEHLIVFDDISKYQKNHVDVASFSFPTMKEFKDSVTKGLLTDWQKDIIASAFPKTPDGEIRSCDFNNLFVPVLPDETGNIVSVSWSGSSYGFTLSFDNSGSGSLRKLPQEQYDSIYQRNYVDVLNRESVTVTKTESLGDGKEAIYTTTDSAKLKRVRYTLFVDNKTIIVDKTFDLQYNHNLSKPSATVPQSITLYCTENDQHYIVSLRSLSQDPSDSWLSEFGITAYDDI